MSQTVGTGTETVTSPPGAEHTVTSGSTADPSDPQFSKEVSQSPAPGVARSASQLRWLIGGYPELQNQGPVDSWDGSFQRENAQTLRSV